MSSMYHHSSSVKNYIWIIEDVPSEFGNEKGKGLLKLHAWQIRQNMVQVFNLVMMKKLITQMIQIKKIYLIFMREKKDSHSLESTTSGVSKMKFKAKNNHPSQGALKPEWSESYVTTVTKLCIPFVLRFNLSLVLVHQDLLRSIVFSFKLNNLEVLLMALQMARVQKKLIDFP